MLLKSLLFKGIFLLFFTAFFSFSSFGQTPQAGLSSNPADANGAPYYIYVIDGTLLDGETKIERSGVFSILK